MDGQSDDDYMFSGRDLSSFSLAITTAKSKTEAASIIQRFETTDEYVSDNFPDLAKQVADLPD